MTDARATGPTPQQIELFRAVEDVHELTGALVVLLTDADGIALAIAGDEDDIPPPLRAVLGGKQLAAAGSVVALLEPIVAELAESRLNVTVLAVDAAHVLAIAFDSDADFDVVQRVGREAQEMLRELLGSTLH
jgi:hypothetical protein